MILFSVHLEHLYHRGEWKGGIFSFSSHSGIKVDGVLEPTVSVLARQIG